MHERVVLHMFYTIYIHLIFLERNDHSLLQACAVSEQSIHVPYHMLVVSNDANGIRHTKQNAPDLFQLVTSNTAGSLLARRD
jgi:hypothetical protein